MKKSVEKMFQLVRGVGEKINTPHMDFMLISFNTWKKTFPRNDVCI